MIYDKGRDPVSKNINSVGALLPEETHTITYRSEPFKCSQCDKSFSESSKVIRHQLIHRGEKRFFCSDCDMSFHDSGNFKVHKRMHTGEKLFFCSHCHTYFSHSSTPRIHNMIQIRKKPVTSPLASGKSFSKSIQLKRPQTVREAISLKKAV